MTREERTELGEKRLVSVLRAQVVANDRTLEQKISDAGPTNQRIEPGILTEAKRRLLARERIGTIQRARTPWYFLSETSAAEIVPRVLELELIYKETQDGNFKRRVGQALEIAVMRALGTSGYPYVGGFEDLDAHDDSQPYKKTEPPVLVSGKRIEKGPLDFMAFPNGVLAGIEAKNYRTWLYPDSTEVKELLWKCSDIDAVPVLIARRVPFITFRLLNLSGGIVHQTYNQLYPGADSGLAALVRDKRNLGYHDVRLGNQPDARMQKFFGRNLAGLMHEAKATFDRYRDIHNEYGKGNIQYFEWMKEILVGAGIWSDGREEGGDVADYM